MKRTEKIIQFGEGGFLRGFADWMFQILNENTDFNASVVVVQPIEKGMCEVLSAQACVYTHLCRGVEGIETKKIDSNPIKYENLKLEFDSWWDNDFGKKPNILYIDEFPKEFLNYYLEQKITYFINVKSEVETYFRDESLNKALKNLEKLYKNVEELNDIISRIDEWKGIISRYKKLKKEVENQNCLDSYWY